MNFDLFIAFAVLLIYNALRNLRNISSQTCEATTTTGQISLIEEVEERNFESSFFSTKVPQDLNDIETVFKKGSHIYQMYLYRRQHSCFKSQTNNKPPTTTTTTRSKKLVRLQSPKSNALFYEIYQASLNFMRILTTSEDDIIITWEGVKFLNQIDDFNSYFLPLTTCTIKNSMEVKEFLDLPCPEESIVEILAHKSGLARLKYSELFDWSFFLRETIKFITRPNNKLKENLIQLRTTKLAPFPEWEPFKYRASRICIQIDGKNATYLRDRIFKGVRIHAYTYSATGIDELVLFSDFNEIHAKRIMKEFSYPTTMGYADLKSRRRNITPFRVLYDSTPKTFQSNLSKLAHAFIFAECDFFAGDFSRNFAKFVYNLMNAVRLTQYPPVWDITGFSYSESFNIMDE